MTDLKIDITYKIDKSDWKDGEWKHEPDFMELTINDRKCFIIRTKMGNLCGYVCVENHSWLYGKHYDDVDVQVHGGLTFSGKINGIYCFGFDCAHAGDLIPTIDIDFKIMPEISKLFNLDNLYKNYVETYKNIKYVINELDKLSKQINKFEMH